MNKYLLYILFSLFVSYPSFSQHEGKCELEDAKGIQIVYSLDELKNVSHDEMLRIVLVSSQKIDSFPREICNYRNLLELEITLKKIRSLPKEFWDLKCMIKIDMSFNEIGVISDKINSFTKLSEVDFSFNKLNRLDSSLLSLPKIRSLNFAGQKVDTLRVDFISMNNDRLERLDFSENKNIVLNMKNSTFHRLKSIDFRKSNIISMFDYSQFPLLKSLNLSYNNLEVIPKTLEHSSVVTLNLSGNPIEYIPDFVITLPRLSRLYLMDIPSLQDIETKLNLIERIQDINPRLTVFW